MKKNILLVSALALAMAIAPMSAFAGETEAATEAESTAPYHETIDGDPSGLNIILVTMDGLDLHWVNVDKGAQAAADELGVKYQWMAPDKKDTALQIEMLNNAIAANISSNVFGFNLRKKFLIPVDSNWNIPLVLAVSNI